jgi:hypothetical protein
MGSDFLPTLNVIEPDYDYIPASIHRTFIGKACPWEIQETIQLGSSISVINRENIDKYCRDNIGVDCGGFVAAYWGEAVPHMAEPNPPMATGISPRSFWSDSKTWLDLITNEPQRAHGLSHRRAHTGVVFSNAGADPWPRTACSFKRGSV